MAKTPEEKRAAYTAWRLAHQEERRAYMKAWHAAHAKETRAYSAEYRVTHREEIAAQYPARRAYLAAWTAKHREEVRAKHAIYHKEHRAEILARVKQWQKDNPEKSRAIGRRHRARKTHAPINDFTAAQWKTMKEHYGHCCVYCERKMKHLTQDHIQPLSKGGSHTLSNIVPACHSCNAKKSAGPPLKPVQPLLL